MLSIGERMQANSAERFDLERITVTKDYSRRLSEPSDALEARGRHGGGVNEPVGMSRLR